MCAWVPIAMMAASAVLSASAAMKQGQVTAQIGRNNAAMAEYAARDAENRGELQAQQAQRQAAQAQGATRARLAANGVDLGVGTAADLQAQNDFFGEYNATQARNNAAREAWSDRAQGANFNAQANAASEQGNLGAFSTLLGSGGQVAGKWYQYRNPSPGYGPQG